MDELVDDACSFIAVFHSSVRLAARVALLRLRLVAEQDYAMPFRVMLLFRLIDATFSAAAVYSCDAVILLV